MAEDARCFGITGREAIVNSSRSLYKSTAWRIPYSITLDADLAMASFDFDVINRPSDIITGRGTDLVHFASNGAAVTKIDTLRHVFEQLDWAKQQICQTT